MRAKRFLSIVLSALMICSVFSGLTVSASSNNPNSILETVAVNVNGKSCYVGDTIVYKYFLQTPGKAEDFQGHLAYTDGLKLSKVTLADASGEIADGEKGVMINPNITGNLYYSGVNILEGYDYTTKSVFVTAEFTVEKDEDQKITNHLEILSGSNGKQYAENYELAEGVVASDETTVNHKYTSIKVKSLPKKTTYIEGEDLDTTGLVVVAITSGGDEIVRNDYTLEGDKNLVEGDRVITVKFNDLSTSFHIDVLKDMGRIYFEKPDWDGTVFYAHIYEADSKDSFIDWQLEGEKIDEDGDGNLSYNLNNLYSSKYITGNIKEGTQYFIVLSDNIGNVSSPLFFNTDCIGDTFRITSNEKTFENPEDSNSFWYPAKWKNNSQKYGTPLQITSVGTVQGTFIDKDTTPNDIINDWDSTYKNYPNNEKYSPQSPARSHSERLREIKKLFNQMAKNGEILYTGGEAYKLEYTSIKVKSMPKKTTYFEGGSLDNNGLEIVAVTSSGDEVLLNSNDYQLYGGENLALGENTIYVEFEGMTTTFNVTAIPKELVGIKVTPPSKTEYVEGEQLDLSDLSVVAYYADGSSSFVDGYTVGDYESSIGEHWIEVSYEGKKQYFKVTFNEKEISSIVISSAPTKTTYTVGEELDATGLEVYVYYKDNTSKKITNYTLDYDFSVEGSKFVTVNYKGFSDKFLVTVEPAPTKPVEPTTPTKPVEPTTPTKPVEPTTPTKPVEPTTPTKPVVKKTTMTLSKTKATVYVKGTTTIKATVKNGKGKTTFKSNNTRIAKVDSRGKVTALKAGTAKITVTNNRVSKVFTVTVRNPQLNKAKLTLKVKGSYTLKVTGKIGRVTFATSNKKVATVSSSGKITAKKKGKATITVKSNGITLKCLVVVK